MIDDSHEFSYAVSLCTPVSFSLGYLQQVEFLKNWIALYDRRDDLIQGLSEVFTAFLCDGGVLSGEL